MRGRNNSSKERTRRPDKRGEFIGWSRNEILLTSRTANYARVFTELFRDHRQRVVYWSFRSSTVHGHTTRRLILRRTEGFIQISTVFRRCTFFFFISQPLSLFAFATNSEFARFYFQITSGLAIPLEIAAISRTNEPLCRQSPRVSTLYFKRLPSHSKRQNQTGISDPCAHSTTVTISFLP